MGLSHAEKYTKIRFTPTPTVFTVLPQLLISFFLFSIYNRSRLQTFQRPPPIDVWRGRDYDGISCATNVLINTDKRIQLNVSNKNDILQTSAISS